jgi:hypothetical protein
MTKDNQPAGHTAGEWLCDRSTDGRAYGVSAKNAHGYRVPVVNWRGLSKPASPEGQANARLIASAPDFFEAAKSLLEAWDARTTGAQQIVTGKSDRDLQKQAADALESLRAAIRRVQSAQQGEG